MPQKQFSKPTQVKPLSCWLQTSNQWLQEAPEGHLHSRFRKFFQVQGKSIPYLTPLLTPHWQWLTSSNIQSKKSTTKKPSGHKPRKDGDVPVNLWDVGAWCDDMPEPEQYEKPCKEANPNL
ncbi:uncharacterized protein PG986_002489 [Apiospora aurea]|uniref:Uncharacterized protein n=1 Tax=Apiospora aurea TaxID=335848 RepID=A0ABR1QPG6_9PEZI